MSNSVANPEPAETIVPVKIPQPEDHAPPSLAQPASGPAAEMHGALTSDAEKPANGEAEATVGINGTAAGTVTDTEKPSEPEPTTADAEKPVEAATTEPSADTEMKDAEQAEAPPAAEAGETNGTPAAKPKRKSSTGVPEHRSKTLKKKQSKAKITNLDAKPGDYYLARLRSYPPWPSIICDEAMLPDVLLNTRPVTAQQKDGSWRDAYEDGGKKVNDRVFPVMFMYTNEFGWIPNTDLTPLEPESCKDVAEKGKTKALIEAYKVAAEGHDIDHFKNMLMEHESFVRAEEEARAQKEAEKVAKAEKKKKRKSEVKVDEDVEMEDADEEAPKKSSKKRKKDAGSDDEGPEKPAKTPKTTKLKLTTGKTPTTDKKSEKKASKPKSEKKKKAKAEEEDESEEPEKEEAPPVDPVQARKDREKEVLFLRHKLQKGFLSRDQEPSEEEMPQMATYIKKLEAYNGTLEVSIIRQTKINKVLKGILKLNTIPKDEEYHFRERSVKLLGIWNQLLGAEPADGEKSAKEDKATPTETTTNGVQKEVEKEVDEKVEPKVEEPKDNTVAADEAVDKISAEVPADAGDKAAAVEEVQKEESKTNEVAAPAVEDKAPASAEGAAEAQEVVKANE